MRVSVVVCEACNKIAMNEMDWVKSDEGQETLLCTCGEMCFTLLELENYFIPEGALVVESVKEDVSS